MKRFLSLILTPELLQIDIQKGSALRLYWVGTWFEYRPGFNCSMLSEVCHDFLQFLQANEIC